MLWIDEITEHARLDVWYLQCLANVKARETAFLDIRNSLPDEQRQQLDSYIAACEELEHALLPIAYRLGKEQKNGNEQKWPPE